MPKHTKKINMMALKIVTLPIYLLKDVVKQDNRTHHEHLPKCQSIFVKKKLIKVVLILIKTTIQPQELETRALKL